MFSSLLRSAQSILKTPLRQAAIRSGSSTFSGVGPFTSLFNTNPIRHLPNLNTQSYRYLTLNQLKRGAGKPRKKRLIKSRDLKQCPQKKGVVLRIMLLKPKKPNSAQRKAARIRLTNGQHISAYIPGEGHNAQEHSVILVRGGRCQDLPGVKYHCVRGTADLSPVADRTTSRSKYGVKKPKVAKA